MKILTEAWKFSLPLFIIAVFLYILNWWIAGSFFLLWGFFCLFFFRDPLRALPDNPNEICSPADGKVDTIEILEHPSFTGGKAYKIGIFLSIFDVHLNRVPLPGRVVDRIYTPGRFLSAMNKESSEKNESNLISLDTNAGTIFVKQIAGVIARRIICYVRKGDEVRHGQKIGLICFGSRTELYIPASANLIVKKGDRVNAGSSIIGILPDALSGVIKDEES